MDSLEVFVVVFYGFVILNIVLFNHRLISSLKELEKDEIEFILYRESKNLNFSLILTILGVALFYIYLSTLAFIITFVFAFILIFSYSALKKNLNKVFTSS
jgi:flagellar biosynthesis protein FlhB